jgi:hypothetical protein|tara:strand:- start:45 stop:1169 length:1125 start_codon:yes stop_codon:yes gene_type:complete
MGIGFLMDLNYYKKKHYKEKNMTRLKIARYALAILLLAPLIGMSQTAVLVDPSVVESPAVGADLDVSIQISQGKNIAGYQFTLEFDNTALEYVTIVNADFLPAGAFAIPPKVNGGKVTLAATSLAGGTNGDGALAKATFKVLKKSDSALKLSGVKLSDPDATAIASKSVDGKIASELAAVVTKRPFGGQSLKLSATITKAGSPVTALKAVSQDAGIAKAGTFIEYQVKFSNLSALKVGGVYVHTADGQVIGPSDVVQGMRLQADEDGGWIHSRLSLTPVKGKQIAAITVGTKVDSAPAGLFSMFVDNIQMTDGNKTLQPIWLSSANAGDTVATEPYGDLIGVESLDIGVSDDVKIAVEPKNKVVTIWGKIKSVK